MSETDRSELHRMVDALPQCEALVAKRFLQFLVSQSDDTLLQVFLNAPEDDERFTEGDRDAIKEAEDDIARGRTQPFNEVLKEFGP